MTAIHRSGVLLVANCGQACCTHFSTVPFVLSDAAATPLWKKRDSLHVCTHRRLVDQEEEPLSDFFSHFCLTKNGGGSELDSWALGRGGSIPRAI